MPTPHLPNYVRSLRKRFGLSQQDVAFLLGGESGARVCRYEAFTRSPNLEAALAFEVIFRKPMRELFPGLYRKIQKEVVNRAKARAAMPDGRNASWQTVRRRESLTGIAASESISSPS